MYVYKLLSIKVVLQTKSEIISHFLIKLSSTKPGLFLFLGKGLKILKFPFDLKYDLF